MAFQAVPTGGGTAAADSVAIPLTALTDFGLTAEEVTNDEEGVQNCIYAMLKAMQAEDFSGLIGLSKPASSTLTAAGGNLLTDTHTLTVTSYGKTGGTVGMIPLPTSGTFNGLGGLKITDVFTGAAKIGSAGAVSTEALLIPTADLIPYGSPAHAALIVGQDSRAWFAALYQYLANNATLRTASVASAITARTQGGNTIFTPPAAFTDETNPTSGVATADLPISIFANRTYSISFQRVIDPATDTISNNFTTA